jgi:hypothetical protein
LRQMLERIGRSGLVDAFWERCWFKVLCLSLFYLPYLLTLLRELELGRI